MKHAPDIACQLISNLLGTAQADLDNWKDEINEYAEELQAADEAPRHAERQETMNEYRSVMEASPMLLTALEGLIPFAEAECQSLFDLHENEEAEHLGAQIRLALDAVKKARRLP